MLKGLYSYRRFIWQTAVAELRHRYAGTGLGLFWNVLHPLSLIAVYSVVFTSIMVSKSSEIKKPIDFVLYLCSGLLPYLAFSECVTRGASAFTDNAAYLKRLPIPEQVFVARSAASATLGLAISFSLLLILALLMGLRPSLTWLLLPIPIIALQLLGFGLGLLFGTLNVFFRDVAQILGVLLQVILWTVPIVYLEEFLPGALRRAMVFHPLYPELAAIRDLFLHHRLPQPWVWPAMVAWPTVITAIASTVFRRLRVEIRDLL